VSDFLKKTIGSGGFLSSLTPEFGKLMATVTDNGFAGKNFLGIDTYPPSHDIWGSSKNTLLYIKDSTLRVTANGYAIHLKKTDIQQAVHDFTFKFQEMLTRYKNNSLYPINSALEIRVTNLDDPQYVAVTPGMKAESPVISSLSQDELATHNQWDIALWVDVLTMPGTPGSNQFYREIEDWLLQRFSGNAGRVLPEWSKGWAYTDNGGPWTNQQFIENIRQSFTTNRDSNNNWKFEVETLKKYDRYNLFSNPLLDMLFTTP
jgi:hypothetical protein